MTTHRFADDASASAFTGNRFFEGVTIAATVSAVPVALLLGLRWETSLIVDFEVSDSPHDLLRRPR
jgi:hypothetical protein